MLKAPVQTATATIDTLCGRLQSATLLEDRRAAILGLRSFAKQYPASVASGSLRELIAILRRDGLGEKSSRDDAGGRKGGGGGEGTGDVDTIRLVLETLLMLFNPDAGSPEAGDEIAFFMADEFSMRQDNFSLLLSLLDPTSPYADYYARLYSLQLLSAICAARPERLQECILSAPLGISRLVGMLDDARDAIRNAALLLLVDLTSGANEDLRKIVAFEDVFGRAFALIKMEGGLVEAGITAQDCLSLLANLLDGSASNQTMFRESGCVIQLAQLLEQVFPPSTPEAAFMTQSREKSAFGLLQLLRLFFVPGESSTPQNQTAFFRTGTAQTLIDIGFSRALPPPIRSVSIKCAAELISNNAPLQENFAALTILTPAAKDAASPPAQQVNGSRSTGPSNKTSARPSAEQQRAYIIEALLDLTLDRPQEDSMLRAAGCALLQAYLSGHDRIRAHFLQRAISGHAQQESASNVLSTLAQPGDDATSLLFASWIVQDLIAGDLEAKTALATVKEGNESEGEDVLTFIQTLGSELENRLLKSPDEAVIAAYASLLTTFLWDFASGVDDLLAESSSVLQALASTSKATPTPTATTSAVKQGLAATLLGTIYEFSTKDSPIPRRTIAPLLTQKLSRSKYLDALGELRRHPGIRDLDLQEGGGGGGSPRGGLFCRTFVEFYTVEYARLRKAIDKDPGIEVLPPSAAEAGVDRDVLDDLRQQLQTAKDALAQAQSEGLAASQKAEQDRLAAGKDLQTANAEVERLRKINQGLQSGHEAELASLQQEREGREQSLRSEHARALDSANQASQLAVQSAVRESEAGFTARTQEYERRIAEMGNSLRAEQTGHTATKQSLESLTARHAELDSREKGLSEQVSDLGKRHAKLEREHAQLQTSATSSGAELERVRREAETGDTEVRGLRETVRELREEIKAREAELVAERAGFAELEKELESAKKASSGAASATAGSAREDGGADAGDGKAEAQQIEHLESELEEAREGEKAAKEELESMLLVMGDIEAKRDVYRERVRALGGEVSEDEDEDEDGDEDEEDEEDDDDGDVD